VLGVDVHELELEIGDLILVWRMMIADGVGVVREGWDRG
jgi:hypothetical protein